MPYSDEVNDQNMELQELNEKINSWNMTLNAKKK